MSQPSNGTIAGEYATGTIGPVNTVVNAVNATGNLFSGFNFPSNAMNAFLNFSGKLTGEHKLSMNPNVATHKDGGDTFSVGHGETKTGYFVLSKNYIIRVKEVGDPGELKGWLSAYQISQLRKRAALKSSYRFGGKVVIKIEVRRARSDQGLWHITSLLGNPVDTVTNPWFANTEMKIEARLNHEEELGVIDLLCTVSQTGLIPCVPSESQFSQLCIYGDGSIGGCEGVLFEGLGSQLVSPKPPTPTGADAYIQSLKRGRQLVKLAETRTVEKNFDGEFKKYVYEVLLTLKKDYGHTPNDNKSLRETLLSGIDNDLVVLHDPHTGAQYYLNTNRRNILVGQLGESSEKFVESLIRDGETDETIIRRYNQKSRLRQLQTMTTRRNHGSGGPAVVEGMQYDDDDEAERIEERLNWQESVSNLALDAADYVSTLFGGKAEADDDGSDTRPQYNVTDAGEGTSGYSGVGGTNDQSGLYGAKSNVQGTSYRRSSNSTRADNDGEGKGKEQESDTEDSNSTVGANSNDVTENPAAEVSTASNGVDPEDLKARL